jgi:hypothetical protein
VIWLKLSMRVPAEESESVKSRSGASLRSRIPRKEQPAKSR